MGFWDQNQSKTEKQTITSYIILIYNFHSLQGLSGKIPAIVNITRTVCTTSM